MRFRPTLSLLVAAAVCGMSSAPASALETKTLVKPSPSWLTDSVKQRVIAAGAEGLRVGEERLNVECPGVQTRGVSANGCIVEPAGCTANFIFSDGTDWRTQPYIGTAAHCTDKVGDEVFMQVDTVTIAAVGTVVKRTSTEDPGADFALIRVYPEVAAKWGVNPAIPTGGPQGVYTGCQAGLPVKNYGHGYGVAVAQGKPEVGLSAHWYDDGYGWFGYGFPGDSGSGITLAASEARAVNQSAGNFTHIIIFDPKLKFAPGELVGTRTTAILRFLGAGWSQVNADGTLSSATSTSCGGTVAGGGKGGGKGGGNAGGKGGGKAGNGPKA